MNPRHAHFPTLSTRVGASGSAPLPCNTVDRMSIRSWRFSADSSGPIQSCRPDVDPELPHWRLLQAHATSPKGADASFAPPRYVAWDQSTALKRELWSTREAS
jgi:hypothetical protein